MQTRFAAEVPGVGSSPNDQSGLLPESVRDGYSATAAGRGLLIAVVAPAAFWLHSGSKARRQTDFSS